MMGSTEGPFDAVSVARIGMINSKDNVKQPNSPGAGRMQQGFAPFGMVVCP